MLHSLQITVVELLRQFLQILCMQDKVVVILRSTIDSQLQHLIPRYLKSNNLQILHSIPGMFLQFSQAE